MKVSLNWVKQYLDFELPPVERLVERIGAQLGGVEGMEYIGEKYKGIVLAKVVRCEPHPDSDHLHVCRIDDGHAVQNVERGEDGLVQVVCGAPNVRAGLTVVWLPPGATVPETWGKDRFVLSARELRGVVSNGMLASAKELAIGDDHDGIVEVGSEDSSSRHSGLDPESKAVDSGSGAGMTQGEGLKSGTSFAEAFQLDDYIIDIENKMFTHRPDCFGQLGIAREIAGILGHPFKSPEWVMSAHLDEFNVGGEPLQLTVINEVPNLVPRFMAAALSGIEIKPSPLQFQTWLARLGVRPINNVVDVTNYIMLLTGQPLHAYDYDKLQALSGENGATIAVRHPRSNEEIALLNGKTIKPREEAIMIATDKQLIGVGGAMGGSETEVDENTKAIVLEVATFDMYSIRRTSMAHGLFTEAVTRFNKGQSPLQNDEVMAESIRTLQHLSGAQLAAEIIDNNHVDATRRERRWVHPPVPVATEFINSRLGFNLTPEDIQTLLQNVEFHVELSSASHPERSEGSQDSSAIPQNDTRVDHLTVTSPFWRTDVETREDVVEEVGRLYGFDKLPLELPKRSIKPAQHDALFDLKSAVRSTLAKAGANEVLTYSFVHGDLLEKVGQDVSQAYQVSNALSPDLQYYRLGLTPSLLEKVHANIKAGYDRFALFELGKVHGKSETDDDGLPKEFERLGLVIAADPKAAARFYSGAPYYAARKFARAVIGTNRTLQLIPLAAADLDSYELTRQMVAPYEPDRSAVLHDGERIVGVVGEFKRSVARAFKLPDFCAGLELFLGALAGAHSEQYTSLSRYPEVTQDITLKVAADVSYQALYDTLWNEVESKKPEQTLATLEPLDIYQRPDDPSHKQLSFRLKVSSYVTTLTDKEVATFLGLVANTAKEKLGAEQV